MSTDIPPSSRTSFFIWAAWYSLIGPFATAVVGYALVFVADRSPQPKHFIGVVSTCGLLIVMSSLLLGIASFFGTSRHGAKLILWKAIVGILASLAIGAVAFVMGVANAMGNGP